MPWPTAISRLYNLNNTAWVDDRERVDEEFDQLVDQFNALLSESQNQELRITDHINDLAFHAGRRPFPPVSLQVEVGTDADSDVRITLDAVLMDDHETYLEGVDETGDIYDDPSGGSGGLDVGGVPAIDVFYYVWLVSKTSAPYDTVVLFSASMAAPNLALLLAVDPDYTATSLVAVIRTMDDGTGDAQIVPFVHDDGYYYYLADNSLSGDCAWNNIQSVGVQNTDEVDVDVSSFVPEGTRMMDVSWSYNVLDANEHLPPRLSPGPASPVNRIYSELHFLIREAAAGAGLQQWVKLRCPLDENRVFTFICAAGTPKTYDWAALGFYWRP